MKNCPYCKIEVGGDLKKCPICQSTLQGEGERSYFPKQTTLQVQSFFYKLQLFLVFTVVILSLGLDFLYHVTFGASFHWSLLVAMWLIAFEFGIMRLFKKGAGSSRILTLFVIIVLVMLMMTAYYMGFLNFTVNWIVPIAIMATLVANFILTMVDKNGNAMVYFLSNVLFGAVPYVVIYFRQRECPITWIASLLVSIILFVGAIIFKGRSVLSEIEKRYNV